MSDTRLKHRKIEARDVQSAREDAEEAMRRYAEAAWYWNAPDEEHTRYQLRSLADTAFDASLREALGA